MEIDFSLLLRAIYSRCCVYGSWQFGFCELQILTDSEIMQFARRVVNVSSLIGYLARSLTRATAHSTQNRTTLRISIRKIIVRRSTNLDSQNNRLMFQRSRWKYLGRWICVEINFFTNIIEEWNLGPTVVRDTIIAKSGMLLTRCSSSIFLYFERISNTVSNLSRKSWKISLLRNQSVIPP